MADFIIKLGDEPMGLWLQDEELAQQIVDRMNRLVGRLYGKGEPKGEFTYERVLEEGDT